MKTIALSAAATVAVAFMAMPAAAGVVVVGNSIGRACYEAANGNARSQLALNSCDNALGSGMLDFHDTVATYVNRGVIKVRRQEFADALGDFDRAIALDANEPESYLNKGSALLRMGADPAQAIPLMDEALKHNTRRPEFAYYGRAVAHEASGNVEAAYYDYKRALEAAPQWDDPAKELTRFQVVPASATSRL